MKEPTTRTLKSKTNGPGSVFVGFGVFVVLIFGFAPGFVFLLVLVSLVLLIILFSLLLDLLWVSFCAYFCCGFFGLDFPLAFEVFGSRVE